MQSNKIVKKCYVIDYQSYPPNIGMRKGLPPSKTDAINAGVASQSLSQFLMRAIAAPLNLLFSPAREP